MKLVSHKPAHAHALTTMPVLYVNGIEFRTGIDGKPTATVTERELNLFAHNEGFSVYHDDGTYSGPTGKVKRMGNVDQATARLSAAADQAKAHTIIEEMLSNGTLTREALSALMDKAPIVTATAAAPAPVSTLTASTTATDAGTVTVTPPTEEPTQPTGSQGSDAPTGDQIDMSDPASLAQLPRAELFGLARSFGIKSNGKNTELAEAIAAAFRETPEYLNAQSNGQ
ncbi:hypothetical protein GCM10008959_41780 [Deinococcus seoulensis]|uniref:SAP domain-containing protein n=1 Tax=Deinococcus seoulensis TaxID=1837379 RepID=A0ABQ2S1K9_9DEIO|nr:hypothetical protein [Deinococcus seoulensis]GGR76883.1 hypothetical protein GCM10008959_41780 [Deinococcus seoulensis]